MDYLKYQAILTKLWWSLLEKITWVNIRYLFISNLRFLNGSMSVYIAVIELYIGFYTTLPRLPKGIAYKKSTQFIFF